MSQSSNEEWERQRGFIGRGLFEDVCLLSPIPEGKESAERSFGTPSPLPELTIERERNKHDESNEYYEELYKKLIPVYKKYYLRKTTRNSNTETVSLDEIYRFESSEVTDDCPDSVEDAASVMEEQSDVSTITGESAGEKSTSPVHETVVQAEVYQPSAAELDPDIDAAAGITEYSMDSDESITFIHEEELPEDLDEITTESIQEVYSSSTGVSNVVIVTRADVHNLEAEEPSGSDPDSVELAPEELLHQRTGTEVSTSEETVINSPIIDNRSSLDEPEIMRRRKTSKILADDNGFHYGRSTSPNVSVNKAAEVISHIEMEAAGESAVNSSSNRTSGVSADSLGKSEVPDGSTAADKISAGTPKSQETSKDGTRRDTNMSSDESEIMKRRKTLAENNIISNESYILPDISIEKAVELEPDIEMEAAEESSIRSCAEEILQERVTETTLERVSKSRETITDIEGSETENRISKARRRTLEASCADSTGSPKRSKKISESTNHDEPQEYCQELQKKLSKVYKELFPRKRTEPVSDTESVADEFTQNTLSSRNQDGRSSDDTMKSGHTSEVEKEVTESSIATSNGIFDKTTEEKTRTENGERTSGTRMRNVRRHDTGTVRKSQIKKNPIGVATRSTQTRFGWSHYANVLGEIPRNFFVGIPRIYKLCSCENHVCR